MMQHVSILSNEEIKEILDAAKETLRYAAAKTCLLKAPGDTHHALEDAVTRCILSVKSAQAEDSSPISVKAHAANASQKLRSALELLQSSGADSEPSILAARALSRALSLLYPLTQTEEELLIVPRKSKARVSRRKARKIASGRRPTLHVTLGEDQNTNFFCGFEKDIIAGGLFVSTYNLLPVGRAVNLMVTLPDQRVLIGSAVIAFVREYNDLHSEIPPGMGLILSRLTASAREQINAYIETNEPIFFEAV